MRPPRFLFMELNRRCNLKCRHCLFWTQDDDDAANYLSGARRSEILEEFADLSPAGVVVSCGGEPMLDPDLYFLVARETARLGLRFFSVVNGTCIGDEAVAERMISEGPTEITVSLDSHRREVHDRARGTEGSFDAAVRALRLLVAARARARSEKPVYAMTIVCERNYRELDGFYDFVLNDIGADKLKLNFLQPSFGLAGSDRFYEKNLVRDHEELGAIISACDRKYDLRINPVWLEQVKMYHRSMHAAGDLRRGWQLPGTEEHICNSYERNIMLDRYGLARLCFSQEFPGRRIEERGDLRRFWKRARRTRSLMRRCNRPCGISHSVRRESATLRSSQRGTDGRFRIPTRARATPRPGGPPAPEAYLSVRRGAGFRNLASECGDARPQ